jgi:starch synthase (maltosyl-transferring)
VTAVADAIEQTRNGQPGKGQPSGAKSLVPEEGMMRPTSILFENIVPSVDGGRYPAKRIVGDVCIVEADILRDGADVLRAQLRWWKEGESQPTLAPLVPLVNDRWQGRFYLNEVADYRFTLEAWTDPFASWREGLQRFAAVEKHLGSEIQEGIRLVAAAAQQATPEDRLTLEEAIVLLQDSGADAAAALAIVSDAAFSALMDRWGVRNQATVYDPPLAVQVNRVRARVGAWYEMFPRSQGTVPGKGATFREAEARLPAIRDLGFDVIYLPPIHPIGATHRKGRNNALTAGPDDPGSPWAIGGAAGGHLAVEPALGTLADFDHFVMVADRLGMEIALDIAIQCSPDHPWVKEHPEWFYHRPDGTIKYAENPPKRYQDIYPVNFQSGHAKQIWMAMLEIFEFWIDHGVKIFRVDNPHTKPFPFWHWVLGQVRKRDPDVLFLGEAFTRPKIMKALAKVGYHQSYSYFTWRNYKGELMEYLTELSQTEMKEYYQPNFFTNTPDILHEFLQKGGRPAFEIRLLLAATLSPTYGIYSGFELCENEALPDTEEYVDSEKYEIKVRDWNRPGNLNELVARVNTIRRENPALQQLTGLRFLTAENDNLLFFRKQSADLSNVLLIAINIDPFHAQEGVVWVPPEASGVQRGESYDVEDLLTGARFRWGERNFVRLTPEGPPAHILRVERIPRP